MLTTWHFSRDITHIDNDLLEILEHNLRDGGYIPLRSTVQEVLHKHRKMLRISKVLSDVIISTYFPIISVIMLLVFVWWLQWLDQNLVLIILFSMFAILVILQVAFHVLFVVKYTNMVRRIEQKLRNPHHEGRLLSDYTSDAIGSYLGLLAFKYVSAERAFDRARTSPGRPTDEILQWGAEYKARVASFYYAVREFNALFDMHWSPGELLKAAQARS